jgi:hypothetical protein
MRRLGGIVAFQLKRSRTTEVPTRIGKCEVCGGSGEVRYMVAAKLPRYMYLCNEHYLRIRDRLERALIKILREEDQT